MPAPSSRASVRTVSPRENTLTDTVRPSPVWLTALVGISPFLMFLQRFVSRLLVGVLTAIIYRSLDHVNTPVRCGITGFSAAFLNTLFFMSLLVLLFGQTEYMQNAMAGRSIIAYIVASVGINAVVEMLVAAMVTSAVGTALVKSKLV